MNPSEAYAAKLLRPEWRLKRADVLERDRYTCKKCGAHGVMLHVHHLAYLPNREPWDYPLDNFVTLCEPCHEQENPELMTVQGSVLQMVRIFANRMEYRPLKLNSPPALDVRRVHAWAKRHVLSGEPQRAVMKFAGWLWKTGTQDMDLIMELLGEALRVNPESWYAYFAPGGPARECRSDQRAIEKSEAESEAFKAAEREFLAKPAGDVGGKR